MSQMYEVWETKFFSESNDASEVVCYGNEDACRSYIDRKVREGKPRNRFMLTPDPLSYNTYPL